MSNYAYLNARVRAMSARLFPPDVYDQLLAAEGADVLLDTLLNSDYAQDLRASLSEQPGLASMESALRRGLCRTFTHLRSLASGQARRLITVQLNRWDVASVRAIVRGKAARASQTDIMKSVLPAGQFDEAQLAELAGLPDLAAVADTLTTWNYDFAPALRQAIYEHAAPLSVPGIERAMDAAYFGWALAQLSPQQENESLLHTLMRKQVDLSNLRRALASVRDRERGQAPSAIVQIPGGSVGHELMTRVAGCAQLEDAFEIVEGTYFAPGIEKGILAFGETRRLAVMERFLEMVVVQAGARLLRSDPLGIGVALGYLWRTYNEFVNLRIILRGQEYRMPVNAIREELLFV